MYKLQKDIALFLQKKNKSKDDLFHLKGLLQRIEFMEKLLNDIPNELFYQFLNEMSYKRSTEKEVIITFGN